MREAGAALSHAANGHFYRRVLERGLLGSLRQGARLINAATDVMASDRRRLEQAERSRLELADAFET